jgi:hypothetical protein
MKIISKCKDKNGSIIKVGDKVQILNQYTEELTNTIRTIINMIHQGRDGILLELDGYSLEEYPNNNYTSAEYVIKR